MIAATASLPRHQKRPSGAGGVMLRLRAPHGTLYDSSARGTWGGGQTGVVQQQMAFRINRSMTEATDASPPAQGIEGVLLANRDRIVRFLEVRGAGDGAEDLFQDLWMRLTERRTGPIADPLSYVMRAANNLMLDRYRSARQRMLRDHAWGENAAVEKPSAEAALISREQLAQVEAAVSATGDRPARIFRRFRVDGVAQRDIAAEFGVSLSTVEADLRKVYAALVTVRRQFDVG
jgi:RNA polymerase sigma factor (sigma-70 family)